VEGARHDDHFPGRGHDGARGSVVMTRPRPLLLLALLLFAPLSRAADLPTVQVIFEFDSGMCASKLQARRAALERKLSGSAMQEFSDPIEFLNWRASVPAGSGPVPRLTVRLHEVPQRSGLAFFVQYWRFVPDTAHVGRF